MEINRVGVSMSRVRVIASNLLSLVIGLLLLAFLLEVGLRAVYFSADPRVLGYRPPAPEIIVPGPS